MTATIDMLRGLYGPTAEQQATGMPEIGDGLQTQLVELWRYPTVERCETVAANLMGARSAVLRLREALLREQTPPDAAA